jgi:hypothetical protein
MPDPFLFSERILFLDSIMTADEPLLLSPEPYTPNENNLNSKAGLNLTI